MYRRAARTRPAVDEWSRVGYRAPGQTFSRPIKEVSMYIGIGTALVIIVLLLILL